jgi:diguanylate cyclase (GGDEF)-like protein
MGHSATAAKDAEEALDKFHSKGFDIIVTDMDMPRMDGMELIRRVLVERADIDIIAITGHTLRYKYTDVIAAGASDFITKPFTLDELEAKLNRIIRERNQRIQLEHLAIRDPLTSLFNRRWFEQMLHKEAVRAVRYLHPLFLSFIDIDRFKQYNDKEGHLAGDRLLVGFSGVLEVCIRKHVDTAFRYGGDEFTILLPHVQVDQSFTVAERIRQKFNQLGFEPTSLSIGIARFKTKTGDVDQDIESMIRRADNALYHVKHHLGGDKVYIDDRSDG